MICPIITVITPPLTSPRGLCGAPCEGRDGLRSGLGVPPRAHLKNSHCDLQVVFLSEPSQDLLQVLNQSEEFTLIQEITAGKDISGVDDVKKIILENLKYGATGENKGIESVLTIKEKDTKREDIDKGTTINFTKYLTKELAEISDFSQALPENIFKENDTEPEYLDKVDTIISTKDSTRELTNISDFSQAQALPENILNENDTKAEDLAKEDTIISKQDSTEELTKISAFSQSQALPKNIFKENDPKPEYLDKENSTITSTKYPARELTKISDFSQALPENIFKENAEKIDLQKEDFTTETAKIIRSHPEETEKLSNLEDHTSSKVQDSTKDKKWHNNENDESIKDPTNCKIEETLEYLIVEPDIDFEHVSIDDDNYLEYKFKDIVDFSFYNQKETYGHHFLSSSFDDPKNDKIIAKQNHHKRKITQPTTIKRQEMFNCPECSYVANHGYLLRRHIHTRHPNISSGLTSDHDCTYCKKPFVNARDNKNHVNAIHFKIKPYACGFCDKSFVQKVQLKIHFRTHAKFG